MFSPAWRVSKAFCTEDAGTTTAAYGFVGLTDRTMFPGSESLKRTKRLACLKLMERNQNTDPFKFIIYSGKIGEQTPQINPDK